ncbi:group II intron maturase-specific domain-containing protein [Paenibacillus sophorae]|uniref:group II intron maturase-specific domain-containing protein n=1 Tax=Paenibacillus sophorae TaxID=1333845 RepID=UPI0004B1C695|nr:group II intron maturase-specific domain-containing protein [Paenibacillus sophorae]
MKRKTSKKKFNAKVKAFHEWLRTERHTDEKELMKTVKQKLIGHYRYYGITDNSQSLETFAFRVRKALFKWLNRRSQRRSFSYEQFERFLMRHPLPAPKIYVSIYG